MDSRSFTFLLLCLFFQVVATSAAQQKFVYVLPTSPAIPSESSLCPTSQCYTLKQLGLWKNFTSHMSIVLLPGTHTISRNDSDTILRVENVYDFSIIGWYTENSRITPKIECAIGGDLQMYLRNINRLTLKNFEITGCSVFNKTISSEHEFLKYFKYDIYRVAAHIKIVDSINITIERVAVFQGMVGLLILQVYGPVVILQSEFSHNIVNCYLSINLEVTYFSYKANVTITDTAFTFGEVIDENFKASGLTIKVINSKYREDRFEAHVVNVTLYENRGGNLRIILDILSELAVRGLNVSTNTKNCSNDVDLSCGYTGLSLRVYNKGYVHISDSFFLRSSLGIFADVFDPTIHLQNLTFVNVPKCRCGASLSLFRVANGVIEDIKIRNSALLSIEISRSNITIQGECLLQQNMDGMGLYDESTLTIGSNSLIRFENNTCSKRTREHCATFEVVTSQIIVQPNSHLVFRNNRGKSSGALTLSSSHMYFTGKISAVFDNNSGMNGGAISLYAASQIIFCSNNQISTAIGLRQCRDSEMNLKFTNNYASGKGGAVYLDDSGYINQFFRQQYVIQALVARNLHFYFVNNTADFAGNALYGGWVVYNQGSMFNFDGQQENLSTVASNPARVCMCIELEPNCTISEHIVTIYPGQTVEIEAVAVGQGLGTVPSIVHATFLTHSSNSILIDGQYLQAVGRNCTTLQYTVLSVNDAETVQLTVEKRDIPNLNMKNTDDDSITWYDEDLRPEVDQIMDELSIIILFKDCPVGFSLNYTLKKCSCHPTLVDHQINDCDIETLKILKPSQKWINATYTHTQSNNASTGVIVHDHCPFDYCKQNTPHISLDMDHPDDQCDFKRSGILCGACQTNFSHTFGTSRCKKCSNLWALLLVPAIALLGIALVILLISLNLTVSIGMINGLILYANIVRANNAIFFTSNTFLSKFIAWLNLDLGFEVCFYNGLDAYTKTWLQLLFPVYIWALVLTIIILSHHYTFAARLSGTNAVQVLATLFLLSYAKLIRTIITILHPTMLEYPDGFQRRVWLYDGNVDYLKGKHIPLFIVALLVLVCLSIPYTTSLLFIQWLRKYNRHRLLRWVGKLKPLFDAYTGPLKEKHCYWFGLLLLVRVALYVVFSLNVSGNTSVNLMAVGTAATIILSYLSLMGGVYESWLANLMLVSFLMNLTLLTMGTHFYGNTKTITATISVGIAFGLFAFIVMYHIYLRVIETKRGKQLNETIKSKTKQLFSSQKVLIDYFNPVVVPPKPVSHSAIQLQESLLGDN